MRSVTSTSAILCLFLSLCALPAAPGSQNETPRLVVGIVVDQMRYDILYRYWDKYGDDGFKRLLNHGFSFDHARFDFAPTFTGPGHASVYTGTTPSVHGIIENRWFLRDERRQTSVAEDLSVATVGSSTNAGQRSPHYLMTTTIGDELRLHTNMRSRVVAISLKDRGAVLPAGHTGEAYWFDDESATFITSTYYHEKLPDWVLEFNDRNLVDEYLSEPWEPLLPIEAYTESADTNEPEAAFPGQDHAEFPHNLPEIAGQTGPGIVAYTPYGDKLLFELARAAIEGESLGEGNFPDLLAVSFSSPDLIGHRFGPASREVQDTFLRFDRELGKFINYLDKRFGKENILFFLTSDHGAAHVPSYMKQKNIPAGYISEDGADEKLREYLKGIYGVDPVLEFRRYQVYLDRDLIAEHELPLKEIEEETARFLRGIDGIAGALTATTLATTEFRDGIRAKMQNGFFPKQSGDVLYWLDPQWIRERRSGTTHGSPYSYDTRAPLLWYGWNIPVGRTVHPVFITDIAPTLAIFLNTAYPNGATGNPLNDLMRATE